MHNRVTLTGYLALYANFFFIRVAFFSSCKARSQPKASLTRDSFFLSDSVLHSFTRWMSLCIAFFCRSVFVPIMIIVYDSMKNTTESGIVVLN